MKMRIEGIGEVVMHGEGPWEVRVVGGYADIYDSNGQLRLPTVDGHKGTIFARLRDAKEVVEAFNADLK